MEEKASSLEEKACLLEEKASLLLHNLCCSLVVIFCSFISHMIGHETINIPEILSGVRGFTRKTVVEIL